jgi:hypothetical protein
MPWSFDSPWPHNLPRTFKLRQPVKLCGPNHETWIGCRTWPDTSNVCRVLVSSLVGVFAMKLRTFACRGMVALASCGLLVPAALPRAAAGDAVVREATQVLDVALQDGGVLEGQIVNAQGVVQSEVEVTLHRDGRLVARTQTDQQGAFQVAGLSGGTYVLQAGDHGGVYLLVVNGQPVRGQLLNLVDQFGPGVLLVGGATGAVIAIAVSERSGS